MSRAEKNVQNKQLVREVDVNGTEIRMSMGKGLEASVLRGDPKVPFS